MMARKHVTDAMVCQAYADFNGMRDAALKATPPGHIFGVDSPLAHFPWPYELLAERTGECEKVCYRAIERAYDRGLVEFGTSLRSGWLTDEGRALIEVKGGAA